MLTLPAWIVTPLVADSAGPVAPVESCVIWSSVAEAALSGQLRRDREVLRQVFVDDDEMAAGGVFHRVGRGIKPACGKCGRVEGSSPGKREQKNAVELRPYHSDRCRHRRWEYRETYCLRENSLPQPRPARR